MMDSSNVLRTLQKKRTTNFREDETKLLIQLWGSPNIQNKLYLTHRKAPVMRIIAANMQQRGFYRTPDEIKTRIRNLKCLYHRIKRTMQSGAGIGTVDPDWPHFKAMDEILSNQTVKKEAIYKDNIFEGPRCEDIKLEIDDIDINDDMESFSTSNSMVGESDYDEDETTQMPILTPAPSKASNAKEFEPKPIQNIRPKPPAAILPNITIPVSNNVTTTSSIGIKTTTGTTNSLPFPLLILNGLQSAQTLPNAEKKEGAAGSSFGDFGQLKNRMQDSHISELLKNLLDVQKENLQVEKQRLDLERQKLDFERVVGTQLLTLLPMFAGLLQRVAMNNNNSDEDTKSGSKKRASPDSGFGLLKDSKILRNVLEQGIKKYMLDEDPEESDNDDSGIQNDENSK